MGDPGLQEAGSPMRAVVSGSVAERAPAAGQRPAAVELANDAGERQEEDAEVRGRQVDVVPGDGRDLLVLQAADLDAGLGQARERGAGLGSAVQVGDQRDAAGLRVLLDELGQIDVGGRLVAVQGDDSAVRRTEVCVRVLAVDDPVFVVGERPRLRLDDSGQVPAHRCDQRGHTLGDGQELALRSLLQHDCDASFPSETNMVWTNKKTLEASFGCPQKTIVAGVLYKV